MRPAHLFLSALVIAGAGCGIGCSGTSGTTSPSTGLSTQYVTSRDGAFRYRLPPGWVDATADSQSAGHAVWLLRNDYAATIAVSEIRVDPDARDDLRARGIMQLAQLSMSLAAGGKPYVLYGGPELSTVRGRTSCVYQLTTSPGGDLLRVVLLDLGGKIYMVTALVPAETNHGLQSDVFAAQDAFLGSLRW